MTKEKIEKNDEPEQLPNDHDYHGQFYNQYATKKTLSNGLLDGALLANNAAQLKYLLSGNLARKDILWYISLTLVIVSIAFQLIVFCFLGILGRSNIADQSKKRSLEFMNNIVLILTGVLLAINVITNILVQVDLENYVLKNNTNA